MAKKRGVQGSDRGPESILDTAADLLRGPEVDPAVHDQGQFGNAVLQARMGGEQQVATSEADLVAEVARPAVERAMLVLQLDPHDPAKTERLTEILTRSNLPEKHDLQTQLQTDATMRSAVDRLLDAELGGHDAETRWAIDAVLDAVNTSLAGSMIDGQWVDSVGAVSLPEAAATGSLSERGAALIEAIADARAPAPVSGSGRSVASLVRSLALVATLDEEEEEEEWVGSSTEVG